MYASHNWHWVCNFYTQGAAAIINIVDDDLIKDWVVAIDIAHSARVKSVADGRVGVVRRVAPIAIFIIRCAHEVIIAQHGLTECGACDVALLVKKRIGEVVVNIVSLALVDNVYNCAASVDHSSIWHICDFERAIQACLFSFDGDYILYPILVNVKLCDCLFWASNGVIR